MGGSEINGHRYPVLPNASALAAHENHMERGQTPKDDSRPRDIAMKADRLATLFWLAVTAAILLVCLYARCRLLDVPLERDEGEYAYMGQLLLQGVPPYLQAYSMKLPGVSAAYALAMLLFGQTIMAVHIGLLLVNVGCTALVGLLGRRLFDPPAAMAAAASFALLSVSQSVLGVFAHATHFVVLFAMAGFVLLLQHLASGRLLPLLAGGCCLGLAITMKQHAVFMAAFAVVYLPWRIWQRKADCLRPALFSAGALLLSMAAPLVLLALTLAFAGVFPQFWFWTFTYASGYATSLSLRDGASIFADRLPTIVGPQWPLWLLAACGAVAVAVRPKLCRDPLLLFGLLLSSFLAVCPGFYFREHYFVMLLPAVALLVGAAFAAAEHWLAIFRPPWLTTAIPCLAMVLASGWSVYRERQYLLQLSPLEVSRATYGANPFPESLEVARFLREQTAPGDRIAVLGSEPQIYFYSGRRSASGHIYMYGLMEEHRDAGRMQREMIAEIEAAQPRYLVMVSVPTSWLARPQSVPLLFTWLDRYLGDWYDPVGAVDIYGNRSIYSLEQPDPAPSSKFRLILYERKLQPPPGS